MGFKKKLATAIATGDTSYSGAVGDRLKKTAKKLVEKFYGSLVVVEEEIIEMTLRIMDRQHYILHRSHG
ncbi:hypothetical protein HED50_04685 [Ochrobactrum oryzae]|nr:hypothetical protein [Brucella oryzae]